MDQSHANTKLFFKKQILICQEAEGFQRILILTFSSFFSLLQFHFGNFFIFLYLRLYVIAQYVKTILEVGRVCWHSGMGDLQRQHWEHQDQQVQKQKTLYMYCHMSEDGGLIQVQVQFWK